MYDPLPVDLFMTKSIEYLLVMAFLVCLVLFWRILARRPDPEPTPLPVGPGATTPSGWFRLPLERLYHLGHSWARPEPDGLVTVGVDDFAQKLVGFPDAVDLPREGALLEQGEPALSLTVGDRSVDLLAPIDGRVVARNTALLEDPELMNLDPYESGWMLRLAPRDLDANRPALIEGATARSWMESMEDSLRERMSPSLGLLLQDGGVPVSGIARTLAGDEWDQLTREYLLS